MTFLLLLASACLVFAVWAAYTKIISTGYVKSRPRLEAALSRTAFSCCFLIDISFNTAVIVYIVSIFSPMSPVEIVATFVLLLASTSFLAWKYPKAKPVIAK